MGGSRGGCLVLLDSSQASNFSLKVLDLGMPFTSSLRKPLRKGCLLACSQKIM